MLEDSGSTLDAVASTFAVQLAQVDIKCAALLNSRFCGYVPKQAVI